MLCCPLLLRCSLPSSLSYQFHYLLYCLLRIFTLNHSTGSLRCCYQYLPLLPTGHIQQDTAVKPILQIYQMDKKRTQYNRRVMDVSAVGLWGPLGRTFMDVRCSAPEFCIISWEENWEDLWIAREREIQVQQESNPSWEGHFHPFNFYNIRWNGPGMYAIS